MDALIFLKEYKRMCDSYYWCTNCPINKICLSNGLKNCREAIQKKSEETITKVEEWSREHPPMTNAKKFEEIFGIKHENAEMPYKGRTFPNWWDQPFEGGK